MATFAAVAVARFDAESEEESKHERGPNDDSYRQ